MTNVNVRLFLLAGTTAMATVSGAAAQTSTTHRSTTAHHATTTAHRPVAKSDCVALPPISPKIPALPSGSPCPKSLITVSVEEKVDLSPLIGPTLREGFKNVSTHFTLAYVDEVLGVGAPAQPHMYYTVRYSGYLPDGTKFDSSADHPGGKPLSFPYGAHHVIPGWDIGFEGMHLGGKRRLYIPWQLAYGERGRPPIPPKSDLIFDMELVSQSPTDPDARPPNAPSRPGYALRQPDPKQSRDGNSRPVLAAGAFSPAANRPRRQAGPAHAWNSLSSVHDNTPDRQAAAPGCALTRNTAHHQNDAQAPQSALSLPSPLLAKLRLGRAGARHL